ncbi:hypothetical protein HY967_04880 [Candidatus Jorgensenbacteria bacterium]|nr:hypothetical protein [Candidatus Jorgensenbacteria bacterium]
MNSWYDGVREPWRFLLAMVLILTGMYLIDSQTPVLVWIGIIYFILLVVPRIYFVTVRKNLMNH